MASAMRSYNRSLTLNERAAELIPGGAHTYAKGEDQYPEFAPLVIDHGEGCRVWDVDGNEYIEYGMGLRAVTLGHAHPVINAAARKAMDRGTNFTRPARIEIECAERFLELIGPAEMVKFAKNGSDATTAAVKLARAYTGRDLVAICGDQPFLSVDDWFIGTTPMPAGVPEPVRKLTVTFAYNDTESLEMLFSQFPDRIACVVMEAATSVEPRDGYLEAVQSLCRGNGALFVLDEMITGFRWDLGGAQAKYRISPDLSAFGKAMGNGFAVSALAGRREIMERGGLRHSDERVFLLSTTHGAETHALAAAMAVMDLYEKEDVVDTLHRQGERLRQGVEATAAELGISDHFQVAGRASNLVHVTRDPEGERSQAYRTLFLQELIDRGVIAPSFVISWAHTDEYVDRTITVVGEALDVYRRALEDGVEHYLRGRPVQPVFRPYC